jgi:membrane protease YdiL (CAAX protease family)
MGDMDFSTSEERSPQPRRARPGIAWTVILVVAITTIVMNHLPASQATEEDQMLELLLMRVQAQYMVGVSHLTGDAESVFAQAPALNEGSLARRQRYVALVSELGGPHEAGVALEHLDDLLLQEADSVTVTPRQEEVQRILRQLYLDADGHPFDDTPEEHLARVAQLDQAQRDALRAGLGWFSGALLAPEGTDDALARAEFLDPTRRVALLVVGGFGVVVVAGLAGCALLLTMLLLTTRGTVTSGLGAAGGAPGIYAETFAVWIVLFVLLGLAGGLVSALLPALGLVPSLAGFLASLLALRWPVLRGIPWEVVKHDVGLHQGERPWVEVLCGLGGYLGALPLLAVGLLLSVLFLALQGLFGPQPGPFESTGGPAHPIVMQLAGSSIWLKLQVLLLASFAAPLVEETMFRGVLYRHLREVSKRHGLLLSVLFSGSVSSLLFAGIHPQGWVAIPALFALAFSFVLVREWRGSLLPSMIVHGVSNGLVMIGLFLVLDMA